MMSRVVVGVALLAVLLPATGEAQDAAASKDGSDPAQGLQSPFQVGSGATLLVAQEKKSLTAAFTGQRRGRLNIWQIGLTGTTDDKGEGLAYTTSDTGAPGFKAKLGVGHSSFLATPTADFTAQAARFLNQAWCIDVLTEVSKRLPSPVVRKSGVTCEPYFTQVQQSLASGSPTDAEAAKLAKAVIDTMSPIVADVTADKRSAACALFRNTAKDAYKYCPESGAPQKSAEDQRRLYPDLYDVLVVSPLPSFYYTVLGNYQPTVASAAYRDRVDGVVDLATKHQWTRLLHGGSVDVALYYRRLAAGAQIAYLETAEIRLTSVCKVTASGDYRAEECKDAMLGKPDPKNAYALTGAVALDPLVLPSAAALARPGAQLQFRYERPTRGSGSKTELALPIFLAPVESPLKLVVGIRPTWTRDTTGDDRDRHFSVFFFIGARPGIGS